jgi:thiamine biosynthesis protein ThiS
MNVLINGRKQTLSPDATIIRLLDELKIDPAAIVVELNGKILQPEAYPNGLSEGDRLEFIRFVGGG